jgi:hypothetical protein
MRAIVKLGERVSMTMNEETGVGGTGRCYIGDMDDAGVLWNPKLYTLTGKERGRTGLHVRTGTVVILLDEPEAKRK